MAMTTSVSAQERAVVPVDKEIGDEEVLRLVDAQYPGLQDFAAAMKAGDLARARELLARHFAARTRPVVPPPSSPASAKGIPSPGFGVGPTGRRPTRRG